MTEKQRWLLRDLEAWREQQMLKIGKYGPRSVPKEPPAVKAARLAVRRADREIARWDAAKQAPWKKHKAAIDLRVQHVKRTILFEKTEIALKAIKALR